MRMNISIPERLKERIDETDGVNWSETAREAFEMKLAQIKTLKKDVNMDDVVARLRATKERTEQGDALKGEELGRAWAIETASVEELEILETFERCGEPNAPYGWLDLLYMRLSYWDEERDGRCEDAAYWWKDQIGGRVDPSDAMLNGFIEGAMQVWDEVKSRL